MTMIVKGFKVGVDFTGGSVLEVSYDNRPSVEIIKGHILPLRPDAQIQEAGTSDVIVRTEPIDQATK